MDKQLLGCYLVTDISIKWTVISEDWEKKWAMICSTSWKNNDTILEKPTEDMIMSLNNDNESFTQINCASDDSKVSPTTFLHCKNDAEADSAEH